jgi:hypothetical protein
MFRLHRAVRAGATMFGRVFRSLFMLVLPGMAVFARDRHLFTAFAWTPFRVEWRKIEDVSRKNKPTVTLPGTVEKIIPPSQYAGEPEKAEIAVEGADPLYKEIRIENTLQDEEGKEVGLKPGADVAVTIEAEPHQTTPKRLSQSQKSTKTP